jgi:signal transduction histidine kinase
VILPLNNKIKTLLFIDLFLLIICSAGIYHIYIRTGLHIKIECQNDMLLVVRASDSSLNDVIYPGDRILEVENEKVTNKEGIEFICDRHAIGDVIELLLYREGQKKYISIPLIRYYSYSYLVILVLVGLFYFSIGIFVFLKRPQDRVAFVFHCITVGTGVIMMTTWGKYTLMPDWLGPGLRCVNSAAYAFTPVLFVHLSLIFINRTSKYQIPFIRVLYAVSLALSVWMIFTFITAVNLNSLEWFDNFLTGFNINRLYFAASMFFGVANFFYSYRKAREESERRKLRWVLLGLILGPLGFVLLWQIPEVITSYGLVPEEFILLIAAIAPATFAIAIVKYHLMDVDLIINRSSVYIVVIIFVLGLYTAIVGTIAFIVGQLTVERSIIVSAVSAVFIALLFEPMRQRVQKIIDTKFFRVRYNYRLAQKKIMEQIDAFVDIRQLAEFVLNQLDMLLQIEKKALLYKDDSSGRWQIAGDKSCNQMEYTIENHRHPLITTQEFVEAGLSFEPLTSKICKDPKIVLILPVMSQRADNNAFLLLGKKKSCTPFSLEDVDLLKTVAVQTGISIDRINLQKRLVIQYAETERLKELNDLKSYFISSVSHDLQTPLTSIRMFAELMQTKKNITGKDQKEYLQIIEGESNRLSRLIKNVLDVSKIERGVKTYRFSKVNLNEITYSVLQLMKYQLQQSGFKTEIDMPQDEINIRADTDALIDALTNLITNAIKYSPKEKFVGIKAELEHSRVILHIKDKGIGISTKEYDDIFEPFYRSDPGRFQNKGGLGLGLTIVRHIMDAHGGTISVASIPGEGSTFSLSFPIDKE